MDDNIAAVENARACTLQQVCGQKYGDCSKFGFTDGNSKKGVASGNKAQMCPMVTNCTPSTKETEGQIVGVLNGQKCVEEADKRARHETNPDKLADDDLAPALAARDEVKRYAAVAKQFETYVQSLAGSTGPAPPDPPVSSIGHTVQFVLAYGGGISPSWTLIDVKGPALNGSLAAASFNRTHILQLAIGPSGSDGNTEQNRIIFNQNLLAR